VKDIVILGGPNGAGKTTAARVLLPDLLRRRAFLNADDMAREIAPRDPDSAAFAAGRLLLVRMRELIGEGRSFVLETTCSGKSYVPILKNCRNDGWTLTLLYFWLPSPEASIARVAHRVLEGGHSIPSEAIYRRFRTGLWNMLHLYLPLADSAAIYDNSGEQRIPIARREGGGSLQILDRERWLRMEALSEWNEPN
jgi:predicted ABC-type ATPase